MAKIKKLLALGLCLCMAAGITVGCGDSKSSKNGTDSGKNTNDGLSFAFCTNTLNNTFQSSIDSKLKELCDKDGISYTCLDPDYDLNKQLSQLSDVANNGYDAVFVIPVDSAGITSGLAEISEAGIPIFNVDTAVIDDDLESFVTQLLELMRIWQDSLLENRWLRIIRMEEILQFWISLQMKAVLIV